MMHETESVTNSREKKRRVMTRRSNFKPSTYAWFREFPSVYLWRRAGNCLLDIIASILEFLAIRLIVVVGIVVAVILSQVEGA